MISNDQIRHIAALSATISERVDPTFYRNQRRQDSSKKDNLECWKESVQNNLSRTDLYQRHLANIGFQDVDPQKIADPVKWPSDIPLPRWAEMLLECLSYINNHESEKSKSSKIPFSHALSPFIDYGLAMILEEMPRSVLSSKAWSSLREWGIKRLSRVSRKTFYVEFKTFCHKIEREINYQSDRKDNAMYNRYIDFLHDGGFRDIFMKYPVLARKISTVLLNWVDACIEFVERFLEDCQYIKSELIESPGVVRIENIVPSISDPHNKGRSIMKVKLPSGGEVIYKPRSVSAANSFKDIVSYIDSRTKMELKTATIIDQDGYGWMEFIEQEDCCSSEQVGEYYRKFGRLICLLYILRGTDMHYENIISVGADPVIVDCETILGPDIDTYRFFNKSFNFTLSRSDIVRETIFRTNLVPGYRSSSQKQYHATALGVTEERKTDYEFVDFNNINKDGMSVIRKTTTVQPKANIPKIHGKYVKPEDFIDSIINGFEEMYDFFLNNSGEILSKDGIVQTSLDTDVRFIFHSTRRYDQICRSMNNPDALRSGILQSKNLEALLPSVYRRVEEGKPPLYPLYEQEKKQLLECDIPHFITKSDKKCLDLHEQTPAFKESAINSIKNNISNLSTMDLERQKKYIKYGVSGGNSSEHLLHTYNQWESPKRTDSEELPPEKLESEILKIASKVASQQHTDNDGRVNYISFDKSVHTLDGSLADGLLGLALFYSEVYDIFNSEKYRDLSIQTIQPILDLIDNNLSTAFKEIPIGGTQGLGSIVYTLSRLSTHLSEEYLEQYALSAASLLTQKRISNDNNYDVVLGAAGAILSLYPVFRKTGNEVVHEIMLRCGDHLLENRVETKSGVKAWVPESGSRPLTGFSHGAAGICYSLFRLSSITKRKKYTQAAVEALKFEMDQFNPKNKNWPDRRSSQSENTSADAWCHGRTGVGMARLGSLEHFKNNQIIHDIHVSLGKEGREEIKKYDNLCCGTAGRIQFLLEASNRLEGVNRMSDVQKLVTEQLSSRQGNYIFPTHQEQCGYYSASFFNGSIGIAHSLLRIVTNGKIPSVLLFDY